MDMDVAYQAWFQSLPNRNIGFTLVTLSDYPDVVFPVRYHVRWDSEFLHFLARQEPFTLPRFLDKEYITGESTIYFLNGGVSAIWASPENMAEIEKYLDPILLSKQTKAINRRKLLIHNPWYIKKR